MICLFLLFTYLYIHRIFNEPDLESPGLAPRELLLFFFPSGAKIFQNRSVSSAAHEHTRDPSGEVAMWRARDVWPFSSLILDMFGYFHRHNRFSAYPWLLKSSFSKGDHCKAQTWEPVSTEFSSEPLWAFQNLMHLSAVPPPVARRFRSWGDHARALTAAWCWEEHFKKYICISYGV